jgi:hypothetical protein
MHKEFKKEVDEKSLCSVHWESDAKFHDLPIYRYSGSDIRIVKG